ncbi:hypothetical protein ACU42Y_09980 [Proteus mirabilis]
MITGVIKGKAYFRSWSLNVKFEGYGVARHQDLCHIIMALFHLTHRHFRIFLEGFWAVLKIVAKKIHRLKSAVNPIRITRMSNKS